MRRTLMLSAVALAISLSACSESSLPTDAGHDLLNNPNEAPALGGSKFGNALLVEVGEEPVLGGVVDPIAPIIADSTSPYAPRGWEHIKDDYNRSKYKPKEYEHIKEGDDKSKYKPAKWVHYNGERKIDKSKYLPEGYNKHIVKGPNETRYSTTGSVSVSSEFGDNESAGETTKP